MEKLKNIHPFLFALFPPLFLVARNLDQIRWADAFISAAAILGGTAIVFFVACTFVRDTARAALIVSWCVLLFFSYGPVFEFFSSFLRHRYLLPVWAIGWVLGILWAFRTKLDLKLLGVTASIVSATLVVVSLVEILWFAAGAGRKDAELPSIGAIAVGEQEPSPDDPDVYFLILDGYPRAETLRDVLGYDNTLFLNELAKRGFDVLPKSRSNYATTLYSLPSFLNGTYIHGREEEQENVQSLRQLIEDNAIQRFFRGRGYRYVHVGSWWDATARNRYADENINLGYLPEFPSLLLRMSILTPLNERFSIWDERLAQWKRIRYELGELARMPERGGPMFVFAHLIIPHAPFVFHRDGSFAPAPANLRIRAEVEREGAERKYVEQVEFLNATLINVIDAIREKSERPPIIVLHSDHGTDFLWPENTVGISSEVTDAMLQEIFRNFMAFSLPEGGKAVALPREFTPVNSFRYIFNRYFGTEFPLLPDRSYFVRPGGVVSDVTDRVR